MTFKSVNYQNNNIKLMVSIEDTIVVDRMKPFKPDEIRGLIFGVAEYSKMIPPDCNTYAN